MQQIVQIVPRLPPEIDGVGDYAATLAAKMSEDFDIETHFVVGPQADPLVVSANPFRVTYCRRPDGSELSRALADIKGLKVSLVHFVGYGYAKRGAPLSFVNALVDWRRAHPERRLITVFHELYARGSIWSSSFWNFHLQKMLVHRLIRVSDYCHTTLARYAVAIEQYRRSEITPVSYLPVFSTIGEPSATPSGVERKRDMVVFGGRSRRQETYMLHADGLARACRALGIHRIIDVGPALPVIPDVGIEVFEAGPQPRNAITGILSHSLAGFVSYFDGYLAKSSIFAAYAAHGLLSVLPRQNDSKADGLFCGQQYISAENVGTQVGNEMIRNINKQALEWYSRHSIAETTVMLANAIRSV